jgi:Fe-S cluster assembly protein SufD
MQTNNPKSDSLTEQYIQQVKENLNKKSLSKMNKELLNSILVNFEEQKLPTHKGESWRYSKVQNFLPQNLAFQEQATFNTKAELIPNSYLLVMKGNRVDLSLSLLPKKNSKDLLNIKRLDLSHELDLKKLQYDKSDSLDSLSLINNEEVVELTIPKDVTLDKPLQIIYYPSEEQDQLLFQPRITLSLGENSSCEIIEYFPEGYAFYNSFLSISCAENSRLNYCKLNFTQSMHIGKLSITQQKKSQFKCFLFSTGSQLSRSHVKTSLIGIHAHAEINGLYALSESAHNDQFVEVNHDSPETTSDQLFKGILADSSHGIFTGKVVIARDAQQVDANQLNKNLLLSKKAKVDTRPSLEVYADDVKCTHGATTGQLNEEQLFYLISRGIKKETAYGLLIHGFIDDALSKIDNIHIKELVSQKVLNDFKNKVKL